MSYELWSDMVLLEIVLIVGMGRAGDGVGTHVVHSNAKLSSTPPVITPTVYIFHIDSPLGGV